MSLQVIDAVAAVGGLARLAAPEATGLGEFRSSLPQSGKIIDLSSSSDTSSSRKANLHGKSKMPQRLILI